MELKLFESFMRGREREIRIKREHDDDVDVDLAPRSLIEPPMTPRGGY